MTTFTLSLLGVFLFIEPVFAQNALDTVGQNTGMGNNLILIIGNIIRVIISLLGVVLLGLIIYSGWLWMTAGGEEDKIKKAKDTMIRAIIGMIIVLASFAITTFIMNTLNQAIFGSGDTDGLGPGAPPLSNSLGNGGIVDHFPGRNARGIPRNTRIIVQFRHPISPEQFVQDGGYNVGSDPLELVNHTYNGSAVFNESGEMLVDLPLNTNLVRIFQAEQGEGDRLNEVNFTFTPDLKTYVFQVPILGNDLQPTDYTVFIGGGLRDIASRAPIASNGYRWNFQVSTELDTTPPRVTSVIPRAGNTYGRNIVVQITFNEAMDPTSVSGVVSKIGAGEIIGFSNIEVVGSEGGIQTGTYEISNGFRTVTFITDEECGVNSCGQQIFCLTGGDTFTATVVSPTNLTDQPPMTNYPPNGVTDVAGNALDGKENGFIVGENNDYVWNFSTNDEIRIKGPEILSITPGIQASGVDLDQPIIVQFGDSDTDLLMANTVRSGNILLRPDPFHELWFVPRIVALSDDADNERHNVRVDHGVFLASSDNQNYSYGIQFNRDMKNVYQNCYSPAIGPDANGGTCTPTADEPYCCDGVRSPESCLLIDENE